MKCFSQCFSVFGFRFCFSGYPACLLMGDGDKKASEENDESGA